MMRGFFSVAEDVTAFDNERDDFGGAAVWTLNNKDSHLNVLVGSRKFTEGWSSWRVSTMGLLNMGQGEGSQIIQLFGRGVRLKGKVFRSSVPYRRIGPKEHTWISWRHSISSVCVPATWLPLRSTCVRRGYSQR